MRVEVQRPRRRYRITGAYNRRCLRPWGLDGGWPSLRTNGRRLPGKRAAALRQMPPSSFADSASPRRIHPPPFGLPPSPRGHVLTGNLERRGYVHCELFQSMQPLREGARQRRRMDLRNYKHPGVRQIFLHAKLSLLRRFRLSKADPSPALRAAPFSKGARAYRNSRKKGLRYEIFRRHGAPWRWGVRIAQKSRRNSSCFFIIPYGFHRTMHLRAVRILPWRRSPLSACRRYPLFRGSPGSFPPECRRLSWRW